MTAILKWLLLIIAVAAKLLGFGRQRRERSPTVSSACRAGSPKRATFPLVRGARDELCLFPRGAYTDQVDASSQTLQPFGPKAAYAPRIYGELVTSDDMRWDDGDDFEAYPSRTLGGCA